MTYAALGAAAALSSLPPPRSCFDVAALLATLPRADPATRRVCVPGALPSASLPGAGAAVAGPAIALPTFVAFGRSTRTSAAARDDRSGVDWRGAARAERGADVRRGATARTAAEWKRVGRPLTDLDARVPAYAIDVPYPIVAVVGILRPALFVAERVLAECSTGEVRAMIAHETSHIRTRDNARRFLLRACPDLVGDRSVLTRAWKDAAEEAADADAARTPAHALDLAQALIRVARLAPSCAPALASAFYSGGSIDARVRRLVNPPAEAAVPVVLRGWVFGAAAAVLAGALVLAAPAIHQAMEAAVRLVP